MHKSVGRSNSARALLQRSLDDLLTISFRDDFSDAGIDDVSVVAAAMAVPEPASLALFGTALAGRGLMRRRKRAA